MVKTKHLFYCNSCNKLNVFGADEDRNSYICKTSGCISKKFSYWVTRDVEERGNVVVNEYEIPDLKIKYPSIAKALNMPKCPICQSTKLSKLSTVGKVAKVGMFGIFGAGDIGKTWKCNNCGSKF